MKNIVLIFALFTTIFTYSQNSKFKFGFEAGLNYSKLRGYEIPSSFDKVYSESPDFAYLGGVSIEYEIKEKLRLKVALTYERKVQKATNLVELRENFDEPTQIYSFTSKTKYDYLVLPILLKYNFSPKNSIFLNGGPFIGYLLQSKLTNDFVVSGVNTNDVNTTKDNKKIDFGLSFGVGKNFEFSNNKTFHLEIRDNLGLTNTSKMDVWNGGTVKTNSLNLIAGLTFN